MEATLETLVNLELRARNWAAGDDRFGSNGDAAGCTGQSALPPKADTPPRLRVHALVPSRVIAPARLAGAARGEQQAERKANADAERHHRLGMPANLLAHHV